MVNNFSALRPTILSLLSQEKASQSREVGPYYS
jgi:hypothetical protein